MHAPGVADNAALKTTSPPDLRFAIHDQTFYAALQRLRDLRNFLYQEAVPVDPAGATALEMGNLSALYLHPNGRTPTVQEWNQVERQTQAIFLSLTPPLRRKFLMGGTPWMVAWLPVYFLGLAGLSLFFAVITIQSDWPYFWMLLSYLIWLATLGAVGALAFIGMNALSIQDDITFDLTNTRLMLLRVTLGALFAVVLTLPFGYPEFLTFCAHIAKPGSEATDASVLTREAVFLLLPFVLGFSTSLVILILNQIIEAAQVFFGRRPNSPAIPRSRAPENNDISHTSRSSSKDKRPPPSVSAAPIAADADTITASAPSAPSTVGARKRGRS
ncbi:MAG TPA: hypothetical protein VGX95_13325 [Xanthobacteraceae bacterium]|jgi:hypothetical protein|nr:hypothetical protein [Xanthobacteraceae bacterium]